MNKTNLLLLSVCAILFAALREGGRQIRQMQSQASPAMQRNNGDIAAIGIAFLLPQLHVDQSDMDARDVQNRPVKNPSVTQELDTLFRENLLNLTVFAPPHRTAEILHWIDSLSHLVNKSVFAKLSIVLEDFLDAFLPSSRRFVHNVHNLWITFSVGVSAGSFVLSAFDLQRSPRQFNLRC